MCRFGFARLVNFLTSLSGDKRLKLQLWGTLQGRIVGFLLGAQPQTLHNTLVTSFQNTILRGKTWNIFWPVSADIASVKQQINFHLNGMMTFES